MKFLVDTGVWIDFFRDNPTPEVEIVDFRIRNLDALFFCGPIMTEVLQGVRDAEEYSAAKTVFGKLIYLPQEISTYELAADIYRKLRKNGVTVRSTIDCLIAATALEQKLTLIANDRDYDAIAKFYPLKRI